MTVPAKATSSTEGVVLLGGDLTGTGESPQLIKSGVVPGTYKLTAKLSVDSKGRVTSAGEMSQEDIDAAVDAAYALDPSAFDIVGGRPVLKTPKASRSVAGLVMAENGFVDFPIATSGAEDGIMQIGRGLTETTGDPDTPDVLPLGPFSIGTAAEHSVVAALTFSSGRYGYITSNNGFPSGTTYKLFTSTSLNGSWTEAAISMSAGSVFFVAVGGDAAVMHRSASTNAVYVTIDGGQTVAFASIGAFMHLNGIAWNGSVFCIVGTTYAERYSGGSFVGYDITIKYQTSVDGVTWSAKTDIDTLAYGIDTSTFSLKLDSFGTSFSLQINDATDSTLLTFDGTTWTNRGTTALADDILYNGLENGKLLKFGPDGVLQVSSDSGASWSYLYRSISNGGSDSNSFSSFIPSRYSKKGFNFSSGRYFATDGVTIGSKGTDHPFSWDLPLTTGLEDASNIYVLHNVGTRPVAGQMFAIEKSDFNISSHQTIVTDGVGLSLDFVDDILPESGGTILSGTIAQTANSVSSPALSLASTSGIITVANNDAVVINVAAPSASARTVAAATDGTRVVQVFVGVTNEWFSSYSDDGSTWVTSKISTPPGASPRLVGMAYLSSAGTFVMIGKQTTATESQNWTGYSYDGETWVINSSPWTSSAYITTNLSVGFGSVIAAGRDGTSLRSVRTTDGINWTLSTTSLTPSTNMACTCMDPGVGRTAAMFALCNTTGSSSTALYYTTNGTSWTVIGNAVSGVNGGVYSVSSDGPCMVATKSGVFYTGKSSGTSNAVVNRVYITSGGSVAGTGVNGPVLTVGGDASTTGPTMLFPDPADTGASIRFLLTRNGNIQNYVSGTTTTLGSGNSTYPLLSGSTFVFPAFGANMEGRAGGASASLSTTSTSSASLLSSAKTLVDGPSYEIKLGGATAPPGSTYSVTISAGSTSFVVDSSSGTLLPNNYQVGRSSRISLTAIRTSDSKWLYFET